jgi:lysophospholipase L1-like esterase
VDESKTTPVSWKDIYYVNAEIKKYDDAMKDICEKYNIPYIDVFGLLDAGDFEDGLHPNAVGHEKLFMKIRDFLEIQNWI